MLLNSVFKVFFYYFFIKKLKKYDLLILIVHTIYRKTSFIVPWYEKLISNLADGLDFKKGQFSIIFLRLSTQGLIEINPWTKIFPIIGLFLSLNCRPNLKLA